jgi:hypothetical protein
MPKNNDVDHINEVFNSLDGQTKMYLSIRYID